MGSTMRTAITLLIIILCIVHHCHASYSFKRHPKEQTEFDYIVVGGGSTGSVVAGRLALAGYSVLVLEAGGPTQHSLQGEHHLHENLTLFDVPLYWTDITANPLNAAEYEWPLYSTNNAKPQIARGLGGCSVHNAMIYLRGLDRDFDEWPLEWSYENVVEYYKRSVVQRDPTLRSSPLHSPLDDWISPIHLSSIHPDDRDPIAAAFIESCRNSGMSFLRDFNGPHRREGAGYYQFLIRDGQRETPASSFFGTEGIARTKQIEVRTWAQVTQIVFDHDPSLQSDDESLSSYLFNSSNKNPRAVAVDYVSLPASPLSSFTASEATLDRLPRQRVYARREIIVSAGAINSPKLLMLSGIGSCKELAKVGINKCISDLPGVGRNAMDGAKIIMQWSAPQIYFNPCIPMEDIGGRGPVKDTEDIQMQMEFCAAAGEKYFNARARTKSTPQHGRHSAEPLSYGVLGTPGFSAGAFLKSDPILDRPNVQLTVFPWDKVNSQWSAHHTGVVTMEIATNNPISRGQIELHSAYWFDPPSVNIGYLNVSGDVEVLLWAIQQVRSIVTHEPLDSLLTHEISPGKGLSDNELRDYILCGKRNSDQEPCEMEHRVLGHLAGTCRMDDPELPLSVVDSHLRVISVDGLRVADASIMPLLPSGNTHATVMMIGERAADFILQNADGTETAARNPKRVSPARSKTLHPVHKQFVSNLAFVLMLAAAVMLCAVISYRHRHAWLFRSHNPLPAGEAELLLGPAVMR